MLSLVIPVYNEEKNLEELVDRIKQTLAGNGWTYEIIFVNDASTDKSLYVLKSLAQANRNIKLISFIKNYGQTAALAAGLNCAHGDIIITLDSDLENDPADIPRLLEQLNHGYDLVSGWRQNRWQGKFFTRRLPSLVANWLIAKVTRIRLHDFGCTLKAFRSRAVEGAQLYGDMHRFLPVYAKLNGAKISEIPVRYQPRKFGRSNYNLGRTGRVMLDLFTVSFLLKYFNKPMHFFGSFGLASLLFGFLAGLYAVYLKLFQGTSFILTPLPLLAVVLGIIGIQFILMGLLAELIIRTYFESQQKTIYQIKEKINFD